MSDGPLSSSSVRASWPAVLYLADLAAILGTRSPSGARRVVAREGIPFGFLGRRMFVRREALEAWFAARERAPDPLPCPVEPPAPPAWAKELLSRRRRGGR